MSNNLRRVKQAVVLAAGEGQRLKPFTASKSKVMIPIANKPILQYVVEALAMNGITEVILVVGYEREHVQDYFGSGEQFGVRINYIVQKQQIGTGHALKQAKGAVDENFLVLAGDNIIEPSTISSFVLVPPNSVLVKQQENVSKYGVVTMQGGVVTDLVEKPSEPLSNLVNIGIYMLNRKIFQYLEQEVGLPQALNQMISEGGIVTTQETQGVWLDAVYPWDILTLNQQALGRVVSKIGGVVESGVNIRGIVHVGKDTIIRSGSYFVGPVVIGDNCQIGPNVCLFSDTSIGDGVTIAPFTIIRNSVVGRDTSIGPGSFIEDTVIDQGCFVGSHFIARSNDSDIRVDKEIYQVKCGVFIGGDCNIEDGVLIHPGVIVGNGASIRSMKVITENIPEKSWVV